jgi:hypothetical protein
MTADSIQSNSASVYQSVATPTQTVAPNSTVTLSIYIKKETSKTYFTGSYLYFTGGTTKLTYVLFDEVNGTINIVAPDQVSMVTSVESVGDWWRFIVTGTDTGSNTSLDFAFYGTLSQNGTSLSPGIGSARTIWGGQLNIGSTAKPYFPTTDRLNVPRLTYQNGGGGCPSLLLEKQSTNLYPYSEDLTQWLTIGTPTITGNDSTSPDGTTNADRVQFSGSGDLVYISGTGSAGTNVLTVYAKAKTGTAQKFRFFANGTTTISSDFTATDQWQRFEFSYSFTVVTAGLQGESTGASDVLFWGFQHEVSSYPTSYIPTTSSSATRVADACFKTGISSLIGSGTGTWFMDFEMVQGTGTGNPFAFDLSDGTTSNRLFLYWSESAQTWYWGGVDAAITLPSTLRKKVAVKYSSGTGKLFCNGSLISTLSLSTAYTRLDIGQRFSNTFPMDGKINQAYFLTTSLTDAECQAITTI